jgi:hypothetical protein
MSSAVPVMAVMVAAAVGAGSAAAGSLRGWEQPSENPAAYVIGVDDAVHHEGGSSAFIRCMPCTAEAPATLMQVVRADKYRGGRLRLRGSMKSADVGRWAGFWMRVDGRVVRSLAFDNMSSRSVRGNTPWSRYEVVLDVPEEAVQIAFGFLLTGEGEVWADDLSLGAVGRDVPSTDLGYGPEYVTEEVTSSAPAEPQNMSFEK